MRLVLVPALLLLGACASATPATADPPAPSTVGAATDGTTGQAGSLALSQGKPVRHAGHEFLFERVIEDSRCPKDVTCVWEGNAKIVVRVDGKPAELNTSSRFATTQTVDGVTISLQSLEPARVADAPTTNYVARITVEAAE